MTRVSINPERLWSRLMDMSEIGEIPNNGNRRLALSQDDVDGRELFLAWCDSRGFRAMFDKIGNLFIRRDGTDPDALPLAIGSHLDTQPNGGRFDGILGVLAGLEVLETLDDFKIKTRAPIDLVVWTNEEGARFQPAMMGSGVYCGVLDLPSVLATTDDQGVSVAEETAHHGYDKGFPPGFQQIERYVELHIEQGPILEIEDKAIGVVTGGQGIRWYDITITGEETHAGPVPMRSRRDPVPALAPVVELVYRIGQKDENARATIGKIEARPGSINVVPGQVCLSVDLRHPSEADLVAMQEAFLNGICNIASEHPKLEVKAKCRWQSPVVQFDPEMVSGVREAAKQRSFASKDIVSGAGHDAFNLAQVVPTTMIFVPCRDGISHNELEYTNPEHAAAGANVLLDMALRFAEASQDALQLQE